MIYHLIAFVAGFVLDLILGDPHSFPHPIRLIGTMIGKLEKKFLKNPNLSPSGKRRRGCTCVILVCSCTVLVTGGLLVGTYLLSPVAGCILEAVMTYQVLATKCLKVESMKVYDKLQNGTLTEARAAVSMIVGRDTASLNEQQIARAAVETVAENTSDGSIAPMLYLAVGGPIAGFLYKAINTMDSMIGYKNDRFLDFGRVAAKLDDVVNFLPARISALLMMLVCLFLGKAYSAKGAYRIWKRDRYNHASPNSAQTESACAGALGLQLAGDASYFGKIVKKPFIGDPVREIVYEDIKRANCLLYGTAVLCEVICVTVIACVCVMW